MTTHSKDIREREDSIYKLVGRIKYGQQRVDKGSHGWEKGIEDIIEAEKELVSLIESLLVEAKISTLNKFVNKPPEAETPQAYKEGFLELRRKVKFERDRLKAQLTKEGEK